LTLLINLSLWFITAPDTRFAFGYLLFFSIFLFALQDWNWLIKIRENIKTIRFGKVVLILAICFLLYHTDITKLINPKSWITLYSYPKVELNTKRTLDNRIIYIPKEGYQGNCYNAPLPCSPRFKPNLEMRGESLQDGFRIKK
jgi:hypothetical protein